MGEVYLAKDTQLERTVALKILPADVASHQSRMQRFIQEAKAASALNHPNILTIHEIGQTDSTHFIATEYIEGETLRRHLSSGRMRLNEVLDVCTQVASALAAAHAAGIIHRDIKPENIMVRRDGIVKVLDFGLAKLTANDSATVDTQAATRFKTDPGTVVGTAIYMSPEQARGMPVDARTDIFSLGVVVYEMVAGCLPFAGSTSSEVLASILSEKEPQPLARYSREVPAELERIVSKALRKEREQRYQTTKDLLLDLQSLKQQLEFEAKLERSVPPELKGVTAAMTEPGIGEPITQPTAHSTSKVQPLTSAPKVRRRGKILAGRWMKRRAELGWIAAGVFFLALLALLPFVTTHFREAPPEVRAVRAFILPPEKSSFDFLGRNGGPVTVSPDGRRLAFVATTAEGKRLLWVRSLDTLSAQALTGTEGASHPFWSPDSRFIGFFADGKLKKIEASGGPSLTLCDVPDGLGGTWNRDGVIVFTPSGLGALQRVSASGGVASAVTKLDEARGEVGHRWPWFLPDGQHFLYLGKTVAVGETEKNAIYVASLESQKSKLLLHANSNVAYAQGYLLFVRQTTLMAQPFDAARLEMVGDAFPIAEQVQYEPAFTRGVFSVSENGVLAYQTGAVVSNSQLAWFDRSGKSLGMLGDQALYSFLRLSPDGKRAAVMIADAQTARADIWLYEVARGLRTKFTFDPADERTPTWSPDGSRIVFSSNRKGHFDLYQEAASRAGSEELLLESNLDKYPSSFSPDGRFLLYNTNDPKTRMDLWVLPLSGDQKPFPFLPTEFIEFSGQFSPDGRWIAYQSDESRRREIYVAPFPGPGGKRQISTAGGSFPKWRGDGKEIFYLAPDNKLMGAEVNGHGATLEVGAVRPLFEARPAGPGYVYDVTADGQRFLVNTAVEQKVSSPITLVINWTADLKR